MSIPAVEIKDLFFAYDTNMVLQDVTVSVPEGSLMSIIGPNGGGKSTLIKLILGLLTPTKGQIKVFGEEISKIKQKIGYVPQFTRYDPQFPITVMDAVLMGTLSSKSFLGYSKQAKENAAESLKAVNLSHMANRPLSTLSGGEQQRVFIARALSSKPRLLLLDEPTSNIDSKTSDQFYKLIKKLNKKMTILIVSHDLGVVSDIVEKVICVNRSVAVHPVSEIGANPLHDIYGFPINLVHHCCNE